jgi:RNA polymerase sigma-70 factor (ECF subfamily)
MNAERRPAKVHADVETFRDTGGMARLSDLPLSDARLRERVQYASPGDVFERDYDCLVKALTIVAGDRDTAADAVQEAFVRLVRNWSRLAAYEDPAAWVRRVALNLIRDHRRSIWRQARLLLRIEQQPSVPEEARSSNPELWNQVGSLPPKQRTAVALYYVGDLTAREVAHAMHVSEGTVDQHLHRALKTLRETLEEQR